MRYDGGARLNVFGVDLKRQMRHHKHNENVDPVLVFVPHQAGRVIEGLVALITVQYTMFLLVVNC